MLNFMLNTQNLERNNCKVPSRKRKCNFGDEDRDRPCKRRRVLDRAAERFRQRCKAWKKRRCLVRLGLLLYRQAKVKEQWRAARKRKSEVSYSDYEGMLFEKQSRYEKAIQDIECLHRATVVAVNALITEMDILCKEIENLKRNIVSEQSKAMPAVPLTSHLADRAASKRMIISVNLKLGESEISKVDIVPVPRRGWRKAGEKRQYIVV